MPLWVHIPPRIAVESATGFQYAIGVGQPVSEDHVVILDCGELLLTAATAITDAVWRIGDDEIDAGVGQTVKSVVNVNIVNTV
ncbi:hypothetical protein M2243_001820 [Heliophilum fasciatum]|nr:hypothetical protein [Heliophilum fasciatum]MCW2278373.1 hypothetical protein [Heliophilum fasciatum]